jgi:choline dehydrogenase-like flavoprotein
MGYIRGEAREQVTMFPVTLDELIPADHMCRVIEAWVNRLNMVSIGFRGVSQLFGDQAANVPNAMGRWIDLSPFESDEFGVPRAFIHLTTTPVEDSLANAMDTAILQLAMQLAGNNSANIQVTSQNRDGLGTTYDEAGTLWMGTSHQNSVTDSNGRFHNVANAFCADQSLFVTVGSVNPTLTSLVLPHKVEEAAVALAAGAPPPP